MATKRIDYDTLSGFGNGAPNRPAGSTITVVEKGDWNNHRTIVTAVNLPITVLNVTGVSFGGVKIYDFPLGRLHILGSILKPVTVGLTHAGNVTPIDGTMGGDISMGSTVAGDGTLTGADVDLIPSTSIDPISGGTARANLAAPALIGDGATAVDAYINMLVDDADVADAASDVLLLNFIWECCWINLER